MSNHARKQQRPASSRPVQQLTGEEGEAMDHACEIDRHYFEDHPGEKVYLRLPIPGEMGGIWSFRETERVLVTQIRPGIRSRRLVEVQRPSKN